MARRVHTPTTGAKGARTTPAEPRAHDPAARGARAATPAHESTTARDRIAGLRHLLGAVSDGEIARRARVARKTVVEFRKLHGIAPYSPPGGGGSPIHSRRRPLTPSPAPSRPASDGAASSPHAAAAGSAAPTARRPGRTSALERYRDVLGTLPDRDIAARVGVSPEAVRIYRTRHGIPARWRTPETVVARPSHSEDAIAGVRDLVGTLPDAEVARRAGVSRSAVTAFRRRHAIPASSPRGRRKGTSTAARPTAPPPPAAPRRAAPVNAPAAAVAVPGEALRRGAGPPPPQATETAWQVQGQRGTQISTFSVLASDPVDAARRAQASLAAAGYELVACARIGPVLAAVAG